MTFVFVDADKENSLAYLEMTPGDDGARDGGLFDDVVIVRKGRLADKRAVKRDGRLRARRELVEAVRRDE